MYLSTKFVFVLVTNQGHSIYHIIIEIISLVIQSYYLPLEVARDAYYNGRVVFI